MTVPYDIRNSWTHVPYRESLIYFPRATEGAFSPTNGAKVPNCKRTPKSKSMSGGDALLLARQVTFWIWKTQMQSVGLTAEPKFADRLVDSDGIGYEIQTVEVRALKSRYVVNCLQEV